MLAADLGDWSAPIEHYNDLLKKACRRRLGTTHASPDFNPALTNCSTSNQ